MTTDHGLLIIMRTKLLTLAALAVFLSTLNSQLSALPLGTAFTYQGRLNDGVNPTSGIYDLQFTIYDALAVGSLVGGPVTSSATGVTNGLFTVALDFGAGVFNGAGRWLEIGVRTNGGGAFTVLTPRQALTPVPYSLYASGVSSGGIAGTYTSAVTFNNAANSFAGNGTGLTNVNAAALGGLSSSNFWKLGGNTGASPANGAFLGTTDNQPLEFKVNGQRTLRLEPGTGTDPMPNLIGGSSNNAVALGVRGATIAGGSWYQFVGAEAGSIGGGMHNTIQSGSTSCTIAGGSEHYIGTNTPQCTISGGLGNYIADNTRDVTIGGGYLNWVGSGYSYGSTIAGGRVNIVGYSSSGGAIGGGENNTIADNAQFATIAGGFYNTNASTWSVVGGGYLNAIQNGAENCTIGGGSYNTGQYGAYCATIPGGYSNMVAGNYALAAGRRASANQAGAFVWGDSTDAIIASTNGDSVTMRAAGGYRLFSNSGATVGTYLAPGGNAWSAMSDRDVKENFRSVDPRAVLEKVAALPVTEWNLKSQPENIRHIGPMAQDFQAAFGLGESDRHISTSDADGVALAAIQGLNHKLELNLEQKETEITELKQRLEALEKLVNGKNGGGK